MRLMGEGGREGGRDRDVVGGTRKGLVVSKGFVPARVFECDCALVFLVGDGFKDMLFMPFASEGVSGVFASDRPRRWLGVFGFDMKRVVRE